jgi:hypothetical protein
MTTGAVPAPKKKRFARRRVATGDFVAACRQALDVGDGAPDIIGGQRGETGHLGANNAAADGLEQIVITRAMREAAGIRGRPALPLAPSPWQTVQVELNTFRPAAIPAGSFAKGFSGVSNG